VTPGVSCCHLHEKSTSGYGLGTRTVPESCTKVYENLLPSPAKTASGKALNRIYSKMPEETANRRLTIQVTDATYPRMR
jgi:hypothetical protein